MKKKIKVLQVIPRLGYGGAETGCYDLAHFLPEQGYKSYIATSGGELLKFINKKKVKIFELPVKSKNPILILFNAIIISLIILFCNINIVHARSRGPAWSCLIATKITARKFVTTFHGTYNFNNSLKKFYNSVMVRSDLVIAGSNFIFSHICDNYKKYLNNKNRKLLVIFRGINSEYFSQNNVLNTKLQKQIQEWQVDKNKFIILLPGRLTNWKGQIVFIEALNILNQQKDDKPFSAIILGSDQDRKVYYKKLLSLVEKYNLPVYLKQTLELTKKMIESVFLKDPDKQMGLGQWFEASLEEGNKSLSTQKDEEKKDFLRMFKLAGLRLRKLEEPQRRR